MLRTYSVKELRRRPGRTVLTLLGIVIGVAAIVSISVTIESTRLGYREMFDTITGRASLEVVAPGYGGFEDTVSDDLEDVLGVTSALPVIQMPLGLMGTAGVVPMLAMGVDPARDASARDYVLNEGHKLDDSDGILLGSEFAATHELTTGATARLLTPTGIVEFPVAGLLESTGAAAVNGGAVLFMPLSSARRVFALGRQVNAVQIIVDANAGVESVQDAIRERLPVGLQVQTPAARGSFAGHVVLGAELGLSVMSVVALVAGGFVILNSLLMSLGERTRHFAILRSIGATRSQVTRMLLVEALVLGVVGTGLGIAIGLGMSVALTRVMEQVVGIALPGLHVSPAVILVAAIIGPGVTIAAALVPSMLSGRRPPLEGLVDNRDVREPGYRRWPAYVGLGLLAVTAVFLALLVNESLPISFAAPILPFFMAGVVAGGMLCIPLTLNWLAGFATALLRPILHAEGWIALRHLKRRPTRTGLTVAVLAVSVIIAIGFGNAMHNSVGNIRKWGRQISAVDFFVRAYMPDPNMTTVTAMPEALAEELAAIDGVELVHKINFLPIRAEDQSVILIQKTFEFDAPTMIDLEDGESEDVRKALAAGEVAIGTTLGQRTGLGVGDDITLHTRIGPTSARIAAFVTEYTAGGMVVYMNRAHARELYSTHGVHVFAVVADEGRVRHVAGPLQAVCDRHGCMLESRAHFRKMIDDSMAGVVGTEWMLMILGFVVASLGIVNTLTMNVLEQTREIGLLRAVAMKRGQVRNMVFKQALLIGVMSLPPGVVGGLAFAYILHLGNYPLLGIRYDFGLQWPLLGGCLAAALIITVMAGMFPARRATGLSVIEALQYE